MYVICHTKDNDVLAAVEAMVKLERSCPIFQVGQKLYKQLEADRSKVLPFMNTKKRKYTVNLKSKMQHRTSCRYANLGKFVDAHLVRPNDTGLRMCKTCM